MLTTAEFDSVHVCLESSLSCSTSHSRRQTHTTCPCKAQHRSTCITSHSGPTQETNNLHTTAWTCATKATILRWICNGRWWKKWEISRKMLHKSMSLCQFFHWSARSIIIQHPIPMLKQRKQNKNHTTNTSEPLALDRHNPSHQLLPRNELHWTNCHPCCILRQHRCTCPTEPSKTYTHTYKVIIKYLSAVILIQYDSSG